jgi:S1-C subfamily serine protease
MNSDFREAYKIVRPSIVGIGHTNGSELEIFGTGFLIDSSGWIMTNRHVLNPLLVEKDGKIGIASSAAAFLFIKPKPPEQFTDIAGVMSTQIRRIAFPQSDSEQPLPPPPTFRGLPPIAAFKAEPADIAYCKIEPNNCQPDALPLTSVRVVDSKDIVEGTPVAILGFPQGLQFPRASNMFQLTPLLQTGIIAGILPFSGVPKPNAFVLDIYVNPGSSGSPLFTANGEVIGAIFATRQSFSPLIVFDNAGHSAESKDSGVMQSSALGLAVPSAKFPEITLTP